MCTYYISEKEKQYHVNLIRGSINKIITFYISIFDRSSVCSFVNLVLKIRLSDKFKNLLVALY